MMRAARSDITRRRLINQGLTGALGAEIHAQDTTVGPARVMDRMLAVQAQDLRWAKWAVGVRAPGSRSADVDTLIDTGRIVRSWPMRGTLHLVPGADLGWMLGLTTARVWAASATRRRQLGLDDAILRRARTIAEDALGGGRELSRAGFLALLEQHDIGTGGQRGYHLIVHLAQAGVLCWGRQQDSRHMLVLLSEWVPHPRRLDHDEALAEYLLRYLTGHGPATLTDFTWWSQLTMADARLARAVAADQLSVLDVDGVEHLYPRECDRSSLGRAIPGRGPDAVIALAGFDEYLLGYRDRTYAIEPERLGLVVPGRNGIFLPILIRGGRVVGTWRREWAPGLITARAAPFDVQSAAVGRRTERALREYARFLGRPVHILPAASPESTPS